MTAKYFFHFFLKFLVINFFFGAHLKLELMSFVGLVDVSKSFALTLKHFTALSRRVRQAIAFSRTQTTPANLEQRNGNDRRPSGDQTH